MSHHPAQLDPHPAPREGDEGVRDPSADESADEKEPEFGARKPTRFAADVEYRGRAGGHDYLVRVRHRLLDTSATVLIDGVEHDPKIEEKALKAAEKAGSTERAERAEQTEPDTGQEAPTDDLRFRCEEGFSSLTITVRRPDSDGDHADAEVIKVRTVGLGGAGEVDVRRAFGRVMLVPTDGTPSAVREEKRAAHPTRYALLTALMTSARYLIPLLGLGALFSGLLDPLKDWVVERVRPAVAAVAAFLAPIQEWIAELTRPVREFLATLLRPVTEFRDWLVELLFGWIPEFSLPFSIPEWVVDVAVPVILVVVVFTVTLHELRRRGKRLEAARTASDRREEKTADDSQKGAAAPEEESVESRDESDDCSSTAPPRPGR